ncbi:hypothetical protein F5144DRAFT_161607 [Chaetomium tenue]|uniref:Uncharacterized protein n=1 Tax=Chaetomium tenue TaxID=1854479 RepID=A0ACB7PAW1_9PEZI|nr:hypothetical protein F5144DRAFT_161607 [Chaetomium globosum]
MKANPTDQTLFAWGHIVDRPMRQITNGSLCKAPESPTSIPWEASQAGTTFHGLFAESPKSFEGSSCYRPWPGIHNFYNPSTRRLQVPYPTVAGACAIIELPVLPSVELFAFHWPRLKLAQPRWLLFAILLCQSESGDSPLILVPIYGWGHDRWSRTDELMYSPSAFVLSQLTNMTQYLRLEPRRHPGPQPGDALPRRWGNTPLHDHSLETYHAAVHPIMREGIVSIPQGGTFGRLWASYFWLSPDHKEPPLGFGIVFDRDINQASLSVSLVPALLDKSEKKAPLNRDGFTWSPTSILAYGQFEVLSKKAMASPDDTWRFDTAPFPGVEVRVRKVESGFEPEDYIFLVDITIFPSNHWGTW